MVPLAPKLKVITYHFISYRRKSVVNLVEIQNTFVPHTFKSTLKKPLFHSYFHSLYIHCLRCDLPYTELPRTKPANAVAS